MLKAFERFFLWLVLSLAILLTIYHSILSLFTPVYVSHSTIYVNSSSLRIILNDVEIYPASLNQSSNGSLFCFVMTSPDYHKTRVEMVERTWFPRCDRREFYTKTKYKVVSGPLPESRVGTQAASDWELGGRPPPAQDMPRPPVWSRFFLKHHVLLIF
ncbi:hypothetical protein L596_010332 [Steinernema carpocapsae]|uniref:Fringe-like glycosyltransferase domain-containing protein n=1 Tax=Steinernema carpocapsae TaxID=34508 RepID=A0A4U5PI82_STECR|nr:hypothetical protein L596_010332 [Steinernema carpocapsae]